MRRFKLYAAALLAVLSTYQSARAGNTISVLQFGGTNLASSTQVGTTSNTSVMLQFGSVNQASTFQWGAVSPTTVNSSVTGQGGTTSPSANTATTGQVGGSNTSLLGQIGTTNTAGVSQFGFLNGSTILQSSP